MVLRFDLCSAYARLLCVATFVSLVIVGCDKGDGASADDGDDDKTEEIVFSDRAISFSAESVASITRSTILETEDFAIDGRTFTISARVADENHTELFSGETITYDETTKRWLFDSDAEYYWPISFYVDFYAYYNAPENYNDNSITFSDDGSTASVRILGGSAASLDNNTDDLFVCSRHQVSELNDNNILDIVFTHAMSQLNVQCELTQGAEGNWADKYKTISVEFERSVELCNLAYGTVLDMSIDDDGEALVSPTTDDYSGTNVYTWRVASEDVVEMVALSAEGTDELTKASAYVNDTDVTRLIAPQILTPWDKTGILTGAYLKLRCKIVATAAVDITTTDDFGVSTTITTDETYSAFWNGGDAAWGYIYVPMDFELSPNKVVTYNIIFGKTDVFGYEESGDAIYLTDNSGKSFDENYPESSVEDTGGDGGGELMTEVE
ncbi:MAG: fimbrillin family protein [Rikenellaceae bacterium]